MMSYTIDKRMLAGLWDAVEHTATTETKIANTMFVRKWLYTLYERMTGRHVRIVEADDAMRASPYGSLTNEASMNEREQTIGRMVRRVASEPHVIGAVDLLALLASVEDYLSRLPRSKGDTKRTRTTKGGKRERRNNVLSSKPCPCL